MKRKSEHYYDAIKDRSERDVKWGFYYAANSKGLEYLTAHATLEDVTEDGILTKEWPHELKRGDFFPDAKKGERWNIVYKGNSPWTGILSARRILSSK